MTTLKAIYAPIFRRRVLVRGKGGSTEQSIICEMVPGGRQGELRSRGTSVPSHRAVMNRGFGAWKIDMIDTRTFYLTIREHKMPQCSQYPEESAVILVPSEF